MAATCEISNVFSNYFSTMYSSDDPTLVSVPPAPAFGADDLVLALGSPQMALEGTGGSQEGLGIHLRAWDGEGLGRGGLGCWGLEVRAWGECWPGCREHHHLPPSWSVGGPHESPAGARGG